MGVTYELLDEKIKSESRVFLKGLTLIPEGKAVVPSILSLRHGCALAVGTQFESPLWGFLIA